MNVENMENKAGLSQEQLTDIVTYARDKQFTYFIVQEANAEKINGNGDYALMTKSLMNLNGKSSEEMSDEDKGYGLHTLAYAIALFKEDKAAKKEQMEKLEAEESATALSLDTLKGMVPEFTPEMRARIQDTQEKMEATVAAAKEKASNAATYLTNMVIGRTGGKRKSKKNKSKKNKSKKSKKSQKKGKNMKGGEYEQECCSMDNGGSNPNCDNEC